MVSSFDQIYTIQKAVLLPIPFPSIRGSRISDTLLGNGVDEKKHWFVTIQI